MTEIFNIVSLTEKSLVQELWEYFVDKYLSPEMPYLENIDMGTGSLISLGGIIFGLTIGIIIAAACSIFNKRYVGDFVRKVIYEECFDKDSAKTLYELGYQKSPAIRGMLKTGGSLSRVIHCVEEDQYMEQIEIRREEYEKLHENDVKKKKFDFTPFVRDVNTMRFYIPEDKKYTADVRFDKKGASWKGFILVVIAALAFCLFACFMLPEIIKMIDNFISVMNNK